MRVTFLSMLFAALWVAPSFSYAAEWPTSEACAQVSSLVEITPPDGRDSASLQVFNDAVDAWLRDTLLQSGPALLDDTLHRYFMSSTPPTETKRAADRLLSLRFAWLIAAAEITRARDTLTPAQLVCKMGFVELWEVKARELYVSFQHEERIQDGEEPMGSLFSPGCDVGLGILPSGQNSEAFHAALDTWQRQASGWAASEEAMGPFVGVAQEALMGSDPEARGTVHSILARVAYDLLPEGLRLLKSVGEASVRNPHSSENRDGYHLPTLKCQAERAQMDFLLYQDVIDMRKHPERQRVPLPQP